MDVNKISYNRTYKGIYRTKTAKISVRCTSDAPLEGFKQVSTESFHCMLAKYRCGVDLRDAGVQAGSGIRDQRIPFVCLLALQGAP